MIEQFELVPFLSTPALHSRHVTRRESLRTEDALAIARDRLKENHPAVDSAVLSFLENEVHVELQINRSGVNEVVCLTGAIAIPEILIATLSGRLLTELIQGSRIIDAIIGDRTILDCYYSAKLGLVRLEMEDAGAGWWFERQDYLSAISASH